MSYFFGWIFQRLSVLTESARFSIDGARGCREEGGRGYAFNVTGLGFNA